MEIAVQLCTSAYFRLNTNITDLGGNNTDLNLNEDTGFQANVAHSIELECESHVDKVQFFCAASVAEKASKPKATPKSKADPVGKGARARRAAAKKIREQRNAYFKEKAVERAIERSREKQLRGED